MQIHRPLSRDGTDGCIPRINERSQELDGELRHTPDVKHLLLRYLCGRGMTSCLEYANNLDLPPTFREYTAAQDAIGWDNFVMGMTSHKLLAIQSAHFHTAGKSYLATRWITGLITQLLQVTHTQWIYRCMLVHDCTTRTMITAHKADLLKEIEH